MVSSSPGWRQAFSQSAANNSATHHRFRASILPFDLIFFVTSVIIFSFCCLFISFSSVVFMHALPSLHVVLSEPGEDSCPAIFSPLSCSVLPASSYTPPFQRSASASVTLSFAVLDLVLVQNLFLIFLCQFLPALIGLLLVQTSPRPHFCVFLHVTLCSVFHLFSGPSFHFLLYLGTRLFFRLEPCVHAPPTAVPFA